MDQRGIRELFFQAGVSEETLQRAWLVADWNFRPVSRSVVDANWFAWVRSLPLPLIERVQVDGQWKLCPKWIREAFDCDNHALGFSYWLTVGNARMIALGKRENEGAVAKGLIWYVADGRVKGPHAICWFVDIRNRLRFYEPARGHVTTLKAEEVSSITSIQAC